MPRHTAGVSTMPQYSAAAATTGSIIFLTLLICAVGASVYAWRRKR
jgi:hypothetical protein